MRGELQIVLTSLVARTEAELSLSQVAEALGDLAVSHEDIDWLIGELEARGFTVDVPGGVGGIEALRRVLSSARALKGQGERATLPRICEHSGLSREAALRGLALARVLGR
ncbi:MAG: hypothetical protein KIT72_02490 [Polyangiaceae bacterium]|nr:hypothetical protein [Polyangiaceae bacterium]MCW5789267.1 hypothetical protein [Polyangiaceae bacterium]